MNVSNIKRSRTMAQGFQGQKSIREVTIEDESIQDSRKHSIVDNSIEKLIFKEECELSSPTVRLSEENLSVYEREVESQIQE